MKIKVFITGILFLFIFMQVPLQTGYSREDIDGTDESEVVEGNIPEIEDEIKEGEGSKNVNIDALVLYGLYNYVLSTASISYNEENFVSLLSTDLKRSNDFGYGHNPFTGDRIYANSSYYENKIGFTGSYNFPDSWKGIFELEANNDSRGMFDNDVYVEEWGEGHPFSRQVYSREEKDKFKLNFKTLTKAFSKSSEVYIDFGSAQYVHRLIRVESGDPLKSRVNQINPEIGVEYIWSASNRVRFKTEYLQYDYSIDEAENDWHVSAEVIYDSKLPKNFLLSLGLNFDRNNDEERSPYSELKEAGKNLFIVGLAYKGMKKFSVESLYRFDIVPFQPEEFYLEQKYIRPTYDLPPSEVHHSDIKVDFKANDLLRLKGIFIYEKRNNLYNYYPEEGNVLTAAAIPAELYNSGLDATLNFYKKLVEFSLSYMYSYYDAEEKITYHPSHNLSSVIKLNTEKFVCEWGNKLIGDVYSDPASDDKLPTAVIGTLGMQLNIYEGFNIYAKINNLYNNKYNLREGYPEPGISLIGGIRILI